MYDAVTLDQLRALVTVVEEGSFSAAARKLSRVQSAVSTAMANLEEHLGISIWNRSTKVATLTDQGRAVLTSARRVLAEADDLRRTASALAQGLEPSVSLCLDALFPVEALIQTCTAFARQFPSVDLRVDTQVLSAVSERVRNGSASLGVVSSAGLSPGLERHLLAPIRMVPVVSPKHPLASLKGRLPLKAFSDSVQIVLSERTDGGIPNQGVLSPRTWRIADLHTKHELLRAGLGWGNLPEHLVRDDLARGRLVAIAPEGWDDGQLPLFAVFRTDAVLGPAHRWLVEQLSKLCVLEATGEALTRATALAVRSRPRGKHATKKHQVSR